MFLLFITVVGRIYSILDFPFDFYGGYVIEHRFDLSNQSVPAWLLEKIKGAGVGIVVGVPVAMVFYLFLKMTGWLWWLWFSMFMFFISVFLARIAPVIIFPIFYKFRELESDEIRERIAAPAGGAGHIHQRHLFLQPEQGHEKGECRVHRHRQEQADHPERHPDRAFHRRTRSP